MIHAFMTFDSKSGKAAVDPASIAGVFEHFPCHNHPVTP